MATQPSTPGGAVVTPPAPHALPPPPTTASPPDGAAAAGETWKILERKVCVRGQKVLWVGGEAGTVAMLTRPPPRSAFHCRRRHRLPVHTDPALGAWRWRASRPADAGAPDAGGLTKRAPGVATC